ncbi:MAG: sodium-dependent transporter, partial [Acutalibacteraceae bacterium]|nr:sodium-dependent transporter [Acutalibacteraceae bacterium]
SFIGVIASIIPALILPYYSVIGGWVTKYFTVFVIGGMNDAASGSYFGEFISKPVEPIGWFLVFMGLTAVIVLFGVEKGVEKVSKFMMPVLVVITIFIAIYTMFQPGAMEGVKYYLLPDFSKFSATTVLAAMGQLFYSMSLAMGIMITYGSYMKKEVNLEKSVRQIELFDTGIAFFAGLMVIPAVFTAPNAELKAGPGLMFGVLPGVFERMKGGAIIGAVFFLLVLFAALTSSISLMETVVSIVKDKFGWNRKLVCLAVFVFCVVLGVPSCLGYSVWADFDIGGKQILDIFDFTTNSVMMPIVALLTCIFIGYVIKPKALIEEVEISGPFKAKKLFTVVIKYVAPVCIVAILVFSVAEAFGFITV